MLNSTLSLMLLVLLSACAGFPLPENERTKTYVLETKASAEGNIQAAHRFFEQNGKPADSKQNLKIVLKDLTRLVLKTPAAAIPAAGNTALMELNAEGKIDCLLKMGQGISILELGEKTFIEFDLSLRVKDKTLRLDYSRVRVTLENGKSSIDDFKNQSALDRAMDSCMPPLHQALVNYINQRSTGW